MRRIVKGFKGKYPYRLVMVEDGKEVVVNSYPTKIDARTGLLLLQEALWMEGRVYDTPVMVMSDDRVVYDGFKFLPDEEEYDVGIVPEIWMGMKAWLARKGGERYVLLSALDRVVPIPVEYEFPKEGKFLLLIFRYAGEDVDYDAHFTTDYMDAIFNARDYVNRNKGPWDEIVVMSDIGGVYEVITRVDDSCENVDCIKASEIPISTRSGRAQFNVYYAELENGVRLRHYKYTK